jgi:hypothetical protein
MSRLARISAGIAVLGVATLVVQTAQPAARTGVTIVMRGLENPRGMAIGPEGALYVVEAGKGGPEGPDNCQVLRGLNRCFGTTGALTRVWRGKQERVATRLPSVSDLTANPEVGGPHDVSFFGRGGTFVTIGLGGDPSTVRPGYGPGGENLGTLVQVSPAPSHRDFGWDDDDGPFWFGGFFARRTRAWRVIADISGYEVEANPAGGPVDSNPFGLLAQAGARVVADAGANALLRVAANGDVSTLAVLPRPVGGPAGTVDPVPTSVVMGPDGAYYVGLLTGFPFAPGLASVYKVLPCAEPVLFADKLQTIIDLDFGPDGSLYVLQHTSGINPPPNVFGGPGQGLIFKIAPDGTRTTVVTGLTRPTSLLVEWDGVIYVTNNGVTGGAGEIWRIER